MDYWLFFVGFLQIVCTIVVALCSYLALNWGHIKVLLGLDARLSEVEGRVNREIKIRASEASRVNKNWTQEALNQLQEKKTPELDLAAWRNSKYKV